MVARHYIVKGRVQGVGFRYFTHRVARELGVRGRVKNLPNGTVEVYAEGDEDPMEQFLTGIKKGHPWASSRMLRLGKWSLKDIRIFQLDGELWKS